MKTAITWNRELPIQMLTRNNFYRSKEWERFRAHLMNERTKDGILLCAHCGKPILKRYDCIGHHKIELTDDNVNDFNISLNPENVDLIHFKCHNELHDRWQGKQQVFIVYGSPRAGKTTWVLENAHDDDLIVDMDRIWECLCKAGIEKPGRIKANVFGIRDTLIDQIRMRKGTWRNAYVIGGYPHDTDRQRLADLLRAELIFIDTPRRVCEERAAGVWKDYVAEWWEEYTPPS